LPSKHSRTSSAQGRKLAGKDDGALDVSHDLIKLLTQIIISLGLLGSGLFILTTINWSDNPELGAAAAGWIGVVLGYWLK
jgi:hypothetical protein